MATYQKHCINPRLIQIMTGKDISEVPLRPTVKDLPGEYVVQAFENIDALTAESPQNIFMLTCLHCGKSAKYDLGRVSVNLENDNIEELTNLLNQGDMLDFFQATGYFRCKHCNEAGKWSIEKNAPKFKREMTAAMMASKEGVDENSTFIPGKIIIGGGFTPKWGSDAEEYYLDKLAKDPHDGHLWNRLGNLYMHGKRPDLAIAAFEKSLSEDPGQIESYIALANFIQPFSNLEKEASYLRKAISYAHTYTKLPAIELRDALVHTLSALFDIYEEAQGNIEIMPTKEEMDEAVEYGMKHAPNYQPLVLESLDMTVELDKTETLMPIAEIYMGKMREDIPEELRTYNKKKEKGFNRSLLRPAAKVNKQAPKKKKNKKRK